MINQHEFLYFQIIVAVDKKYALITFGGKRNYYTREDPHGPADADAELNDYGKLKKTDTVPDTCSPSQGW